VNTPGKLIRGQVMHQRLRPVPHRFVYPVFYVRVNLARLDELNSAWFGINRWRLASIRTRDYGARDGSDLATWMRAILTQAGITADGEIWLQTFPRLFGFVFNPVSFWYCHDQSGALCAVLAEVNNTFGQSHRYLLNANQPITDELVLSSQKNLHVSPFCPVEGHYRFRFRDTAQTSLISLDYHDNEGLLIKTSVGGKVADLTTRSILRAILKQPWLTAGIVVGIHWQALRLWSKGLTFFSAPAAPTSSLTESRITNEETVS
jgi:DUF1365 family protein